MKILSLFLGHDSSATILENGKLVFYLSSERISRKKHCNKIEYILTYLYEKKITKFDYICVNLYRREDIKFEIPLKNLFQEKFKYKNLIFDYDNHHLYHAYCGFYNSKFNDALCFVLDGHGAEIIKNNNLHAEIESVYYANKKEIKEVSKKYHIPFNYNFLSEKDKEKFPLLSVGYRFQILSEKIGFGWHGAGKVMGLSQYKNYENEIDDKWASHVDECFSVQKSTQDEVIELIKKYSNQYKTKNIVISGGYALNCVSNYEYIKNFSEFNFYIDPICFDAGISIGQAFFQHKQKSRFYKIEPLKNVYVGLKEKKYDLRYLNAKKVTYSDVAKIISEGNIVALFQGRSEAGQRALGNRSLLFDPRVENGRNIVNLIKKRENFRPFAGTVLKEYANEWFDMKELKDCSYMQYAVDVKKKGIPAMIHVNNTCRVQTITKKQNKHFYNLIVEFYKQTKVPMLLNTSFNLSEEPLVETFSDAINTIKNSDILYLYLPEIQKLIYF